jgi:hypothetical protein
MGGGLMQLVAYGAQDIYLTGNPQITFFKVVYRRHTNFSMESIQQTINGNSALTTTNASGTVTVSRNGDLVHNVYVRVDANDGTDCISGDQLINTVELEIGGQRIDKHTREWLQIWAELSTPDSKARGYKYLTGGFSNTLMIGGTTGGHSQRSVMVPLQFWFCRNPGLALPLIALQYHEVKLKFEWGTTTETSRDGAAGTAATVEVWADYIYLDTDERRRFAQQSHEYLIEQLQYQSEGAANTSYKLNFNHPVKELIWTDNDSVTTQRTKISLNGHDRFSEQDREYFQVRQPLDHHTAVPAYNIKEMERPQLLTDQINILGNVSPVDSCEISGAASANGKFTIDAGNQRLTFRAAADPGLKVGDLLLISYATTTNAECVTIMTTVQAAVVAWTATNTDATYTLQADGTTELVDSTAGDGQVHIVARCQDPQSRCSQLATNVNVYSFALKPEEHQPSGTCNFSRIDTAKLELSASATIGNIYAVNYNVLRIMSGMGGLAYSN